MTRTVEQMPRMELTPEERFLWDCARTWRAPEALVVPQDLDWSRVVEVGLTNRVQAFLDRVLTTTGRVANLPAEARDRLQADVTKLRENTALMSEALQHYLRLAAARGLDTVVIKGLSLSTNIYGDPAMRPSGDIDLLLRRSQIADSLAILDDMGLGRWWPNLLDDAYYNRHHLHQQRCTPDLRIWFEPHWALDHPYTRLTIDYEAMIERSTPGTLLGRPVRDLCPADLLLGLCIHLVKHAVYLPSVSERPDLPRIILADGMLVYYLDAAEAVKVYAGSIDWAQTVTLAHEFGASEMLGAVLRVCREYLDARVPETVLAALPVRGPGGLTRRAMHRMAEYELSTYLGRKKSQFWDFLVVTNGAFILRPIRILDAAAYIVPGPDYLRRRYGRASGRMALQHLLRALAQYARLGIDTVYYAWERYRRLKALHQSASLFNRLEAES